MKFSRKLLIAAVAAATAPIAQAAITPDEAKALGTTLTPIGAEKAGNKDGTIPDYNGGDHAAGAAFKAGDGIRPDPFAGEKPRLVIDAKNMAQHADKLTEGTKALLQKYPTFRVDVYPTHRTVAFPKFVTDNTVKNATKAKTTNDGRSIEGAHAGFPFPIPKTGYEAMWNHLVRYNGQAYEAKYRNLTVDANGGRRCPPKATACRSTRSGTTEDERRHLLAHQDHLHRPGARAGEGAAAVDPLGHRHQGPPRVEVPAGPAPREGRPDLSHDTPNPGTAGATTFDDTFIFNGSMDRFDFKLIGKKEMFVPYNAYAAVYQSKQDELLKPNHLNPDLVRWELHRVWVVEATLREGKRHVYSKRVFYLDEDSGPRLPRTSTTRVVSCTAPASRTWRRATTSQRRTPTCSATTTGRPLS